MGVIGFYEWVKSKGFVPKEAIFDKETSVVVDAKLIMYKIGSMIPSTCENLALEIANCMNKSFSRFQKQNVCFVNDGTEKIPQLKCSTSEKRKRKRQEQQDKYTEDKSAFDELKAQRKEEDPEKQQLRDDLIFIQQDEKLEKQARYARGISTQLSMDVLEILKSYGYKTLQAQGEADPILVQMSTSFDYVVSEDSDMLIGGVKNLLRFFGSKNLVYNIDDILLQVEIFNIEQNNKEPKKLKKTTFKKTSVKKQLKYMNPKITLDQLKQMACISGCDYSDGLNGIGMATAEKFLCKHGTAENMIRNFNKEEMEKHSPCENFLDIVNAVCTIFTPC